MKGKKKKGDNGLEKGEKKQLIFVVSLTYWWQFVWTNKLSMMDCRGGGDEMREKEWDVVRWKEQKPCNKFMQIYFTAQLLQLLFVWQILNWLFVIFVCCWYTTLIFQFIVHFVFFFFQFFSFILHFFRPLLYC